MSTSQSRRPTKGLEWLWHRFQIWRAMRKYARIVRVAKAMELEKIEADRLMRENAQPPCPLFDRLDSEGR